MILKRKGPAVFHISPVRLAPNRQSCWLVGKLTRRFCTVNSAADMRLSVAISTANMADVPNGGWAPIAPYGDFPSPDGTYSQHFDRAQAEKVVATWNSITGTAARAFKNLWHRVGLKYSTPVWDGHPESDRQRWPVERLLAEITDLRAGDTALEGRVTWNEKGASARTRGPLYPSPLWWHWPPSGEPPTVFPELLESVGLVTTPNISSVPAWTRNATLASDPLAENQNENQMNEQQLQELRAALGLTEGDFAAILARARTANAAVGTLTERETALQTANSARATLETQLATANGQVTTITTERDSLRTANGALSTEVTALRKGVLDLAEKKGAITPAERGDFETRITTANTRDAALTELQTRKAMNTTSIEINGNRLDLSTSNSRAAAFNAEVEKRKTANGGDYDKAFADCMADPQLKPLIDAMNPKSNAA